MQRTQDLRVIETIRLEPPCALKEAIPMTETANQVVVESRQAIQRILRREDPRMLVVIGPCSIHDAEAAKDYAGRLLKLRQAYADQLYIVMRVYFEKPRTTIGWKGLINDPHLDGSYDISAGLRKARQLLLDLTSMGMPTATEALDPITPQYLADLVSWTAIGARTTESQTHREMASGLSVPVGFKNGTDGSLQIAIDALGASRNPHSFLGIDQEGMTSIIRTAGNPDGHVILRGGRLRTNYDEESIAEAVAKLEKAGVPAALMVDCSHANSAKQHVRQELVWKSVLDQRLNGNTALIGMMVESNIHEGNQTIPKDLSQLQYGVSVTDPCINWETTERLLKHAHDVLSRGVPSAADSLSARHS